MCCLEKDTNGFNVRCKVEFLFLFTWGTVKYTFPANCAHGGEAALAQERHKPACDTNMEGVSFSITVILSRLYYCTVLSWTGANRMQIRLDYQNKAKLGSQAQTCSVGVWIKSEPSSVHYIQ